MTQPRAAAVGRVVDLLDDRLERAWWVIRSQLPIRLDDDSEPEPDVWVARGPRDRYRDHHPRSDELALVVEVSDTSLVFDLQMKVPRYVRAAVPEVWVVSLSEQLVHRFARPDASASKYLEIERIGPGTPISSMTLGVEFAVADILGAQ